MRQLIHICALDYTVIKCFLPSAHACCYLPTHFHKTDESYTTHFLCYRVRRMIRRATLYNKKYQSKYIKYKVIKIVRKKSFCYINRNNIIP